MPDPHALFDEGATTLGTMHNVSNFVDDWVTVKCVSR